MPQFFCSLPNEKKAGRIPCLISDDPKAIAAFVKRWDVPGRGVYCCINPLRPGATRRAVDTVGLIERLPVDIDFKDLAATAEEVEQRLRRLPLPATWLRKSGGGLHVGWELKEPVAADDPENFRQTCDLHRRLVAALSGDPAVAHPAALLRVIGTHNSKRGKGVRVEVLGGSGKPVDQSEIEELIEQLPAEGMFACKDGGNGHDRHSSFNESNRAMPVEVDERLASMRFKGAGETAIHTTQLQVTAALLRTGSPLEDVVADVLEATCNAVRNDPRAAKWDWRQEEHDIRRMCCDFVGKAPELSAVLPEPLRTSFETALAAGKTAKIVYAKHIGWHVRSFGSGKQDEAPVRDGGNKPGGKRHGLFTLCPFVPFDPKDLPPRAWLYGRHYQRRTVSATIAPGGFGKTTLVMVEAVAMATCRNLLGEQPSERLHVWYHNGEDTLEELNRRLGAICQHYGIPQQELSGWFFMTSGNEVPLRVANGYKELKIDELLIAHISEEIARNEVDVVVLDPLVTLHGVSEQDNVRMDRVVRIFAAIADTQNCAIELAHHTRKLAAGNTDYGGDDIRGASSIKDAVRSARMLNQMTEKDAEAVGIPEHERARYFRTDRVKANNAPPAKAVWRRFVSIELPNGDDVGVVVAWDYPGQGAPSAEMAAAERAADNLFMQLLVRLTAEGRTVSDRAGTKFAPHVFSQEAEAKTAKVGKRPLAEAMRRLFAAKRIRVDDKGEGGHKTHFIVMI
jgi:RecA-family ATPase